MKMGASVDVRERRPFWDRCIGWSPAATGSWMALAFLIAAVTATIVLAIFGSGERGTAIALRITARWSFILFWFAYAGGAMSKLFGLRLAPMAWRGRDFGLAYASAQVVHVGLVLWLFYLAPGSNGGMVFFWVGIACTLLLALFSLPLVREALGPAFGEPCARSQWSTLHLLSPWILFCPPYSRKVSNCSLICPLHCCLWAEPLCAWSYLWSDCGHDSGWQLGPRGDYPSGGAARASVSEV